MLSVCLAWLIIGNTSAIFNEWNFKYNGSISVHSSISEAIQSKWGFDAELQLQNYNDFVVAQLNNVQYTTFNGNIEEDMEPSPQQIKEEAKDLQKPFVIYYKGSLVKELGHEPDDALWSVNMKRSIASMMQVDPLFPPIVQENHIYGPCDIKYNHEISGDTINLSKEINERDCEGFIWKTHRNLKTTTCEDDSKDNPFLRNATRKYVLQKQDNQWLFQRIEGESDVIQKTMPTEYVYNIISQRQVFDLVSAKNVDRPIDYSKVTEKTSLTYVQSDDYYQERKLNNYESTTNPEEYKSEWSYEVEKLQKEWSKIKLENRGFAEYLDGEKVVRNVLKKMDWKTLRDLHDEIIQDNGADSQTLQMFYALVPTLGTTESFKFLKAYLNSPYYNDIVALEFLSSFPHYIKIRTKENLKQMEFLLDIPKENVIIKQAGILSFSRMVIDGHMFDEYDQECLDHYTQKYLIAFNHALDYRTSLVYLQGLYNLRVSPSLLLPVVQNKEEAHHLRLQSIFAIKNQVSDQEVFEMFWPILIDNDEHFELRVAALDVLLDKNLEEGELARIIEFVSESTDVNHSHLYNYLYTTLLTIEGNTKCTNNSINYQDISNALPEPKSKKVWINGKYRTGITDSDMNHGVHSTSRFIGDPRTNVMTSVQFSSKRFAMGLWFDSFAVFIKFHGLPAFLYSQFAIEGTTLPKLVAILEKRNLRSSNLDDLHIELIIHYNDRAVLAAYISGHNDHTIPEMINSYIRTIQNKFKVSHPIIDSVESASDFGTPLTTEIEVKSIKKLDIKLQSEATIKIRSLGSSEISLSSYNPIGDNDFRVTKLHKFESLVDLDFEWDKVKTTLSWKENRNADDFQQLVDYSVFVSMSESCPHNSCVTSALVQTVTPGTENSGLYPINLIGKQLMMQVKNVSMTSHFKDYKDLHLKPVSTYENLNFAYPVVMGMFQLDTVFFMAPVESCSASLTLKSANEDVTESKLQLTFNDQSRGEIPMNKTDNDITVGFLQIHTDGETKELWNMTFAYAEEPLYHTAKFFANVIVPTDQEGERFEVSFDAEVDYPEFRVDVFSMEPIDPTTFNISASFGISNTPMQITADMSGKFAVLDEQIAIAQNATVEPFRTCSEDSKNLKYASPTESCKEASMKSSTYRDYELFFSMNPPMPWLEEYLEMGASMVAMYGEPDPEASLATRAPGSFGMSAKFPVLEPKIDFAFRGFRMTIPAPSVVEDVLVKPDRHIANNPLVDYGIQSTCVITPTFVKTFSGKYIYHYTFRLGDNKIAYIECGKQSRYAMFFNHTTSSTLSFTMYSQNDMISIAATSPDSRDYQSKDPLARYRLPVSYIGDEVLINGLDEVYYNKEYIYITSYNFHLDLLCGLCSYQEENVSVNTHDI